MSWLVQLMRVVLIFTGITPPKPENERQVVVIGLSVIALTVIGFVVFFRWMTEVVVSH